jgi:hypothetical protein
MRTMGVKTFRPGEWVEVVTRNGQVQVFRRGVAFLGPVPDPYLNWDGLADVEPDPAPIKTIGQAEPPAGPLGMFFDHRHRARPDRGSIPRHHCPHGGPGSTRPWPERPLIEANPTCRQR